MSAIAELSSEEHQAAALKLRRELFEFRLQQAGARLEKTHKVTEARRQLARHLGQINAARAKKA
jgi:ribosomal protein L29